MQGTGVAEVDPAAQPEPGAAGEQAVQVAFDVAPAAALHVPAGQGVGADAPIAQKAPAGHTAHASADDAPRVALYEPAAHAAHVAFDVPLTVALQVPTGQSLGASAPPRHTPGAAAHATQAALSVDPADAVHMHAAKAAGATEPAAQ